MKRVGTFMTGLLIGAVLFSGSAAYAAGITTEQSANRFFVDGKEVQLQAYTINGNNYLKFRDIGKVVGFNVYWDVEQQCVQIERNTPYTGVAPADNKSEITPQTWQGGKPVARADGNPLVTLKLTIPEEVNAYSFWPWRSSQITELFDRIRLIFREQFDIMNV